jgi:hypothetical protein
MEKYNAGTKAKVKYNAGTRVQVKNNAVARDDEECSFFIHLVVVDK